MKLRKGSFIYFKTRNEIENVISINKTKDIVITDKREYSYSFIQSWFNFKFLTIQ